VKLPISPTGGRLDVTPGFANVQYRKNYPCDGVNRATSVWLSAA
jgi:hypothetical protein